MLKINFEFRKGIFFIRLIGDLNKESYKQIENDIKELIVNNNFKYIVINTNELDTATYDGINYLTNIYYLAIESNSNLVFCDRLKIIDIIANRNLPIIASELEVL